MGEEEKTHRYFTRGTCARAIDLRVSGGKVTHCQLHGGCTGQGRLLAKLVTGVDARESIERLKGVECHGGTSCADQLARAIEVELAKSEE